MKKGRRNGPAPFIVHLWGMSRVLPVLGFFLLVLALSSWHLDRGHNANTLSRAAMVAALEAVPEQRGAREARKADAIVPRRRTRARPTRLTRLPRTLQPPTSKLVRTGSPTSV